MKKYLLLLFISVVVVTYAASPLDNKSRAILEQIKQLPSQSPLSGEDFKSATDEGIVSEILYYPVIIKLSDTSVIDELEALGTVIMRQREKPTTTPSPS